MHITNEHLDLALDEVNGHLTLVNRSNGQRLLFCGTPLVMQPAFAGVETGARLERIEPDGEGVRLCHRSGCLDEFVVTIHPGPTGGLDIACSFTPREDLELNRLDLFPAGTFLNMVRVINFRNRHFTENTWPELLLDGPGCETDTYSEDWQAAPHPTALLFQKLEINLFCGMKELDRTYGMFLKVEELSVRHWYVNYGNAPHGLTLRAGKLFAPSTMRFFAERDATPCETFSRFGGMLVEEGIVPNPADRPRIPWHEENLYCTWFDQTYGSRTLVEAELKEQADNPKIEAHEILTESFIRRGADIIREQRLPIRTILIDAGWEVLRGDWRVHTDRFPDMRGLVDDLHAQGFKVVAWWNWTEIFQKAEADPAHLAGGGALNRHGRRMRDYSKPATQEYVRDLFHTLFSPDPGCYDLDGFKMDYVADKVHPELPPENPAWRGEENYFAKVAKLLFDVLRNEKPDGMAMGCHGNWHLSPWIDINRTYDVHTSNYREHEERARMLMATTCGVPVSYDMHNFLENLEGWFESARRLGAAVQVGNLMFVREDKGSGITAADDAYYDLLRSCLARTGKGPAGPVSCA